jgi:ERCC4-type nuclease
MTDLVTDAEEVLGAKLRETKRKAKPLPVIIVDVQEKLPLTRYFNAAEVQVEVTHLETGDYSVKGATHLLAIERKSLPDLISCTTGERERFMDQMRRLKNYRCKFLIVEADEQDIADGIYDSRVAPASVLGTLMTVQVRWGICVIHALGQKDAARRVSWICRKVAQLQAEGFFEQEETTDGRQHVVNE